MNRKQLSEHIRNIDDRLVEQAEKIPNYKQQHNRKIIRRFITIAAAFVLMACSFSAGAFAFARERVVEIPINQETITLDEINLTLILPDDLEGKIIVCYEESMTPEQFVEKGYDFVGYRYLFSTSAKIYILCYPSDVQWDSGNPEQEVEYLRMETEIESIRFVVDNILTD